MLVLSHIGLEDETYVSRNFENIFKPLPMALVTVQLIYSFDFAFREMRFSHHAAHMSGPMCLEISQQ